MLLVKKRVLFRAVSRLIHNCEYVDQVVWIYRLICISLITACWIKFSAAVDIFDMRKSVFRAKVKVSSNSKDPDQPVEWKFAILCCVLQYPMIIPPACEV